MPILYDDRGRAVEVDDTVELGHGALSCVFLAKRNGHEYAAKIFEEAYADTMRERKLRILKKVYKKAPAVPVALPVSLLYTSNGVFVGYLMNRFHGLSMEEAVKTSSFTMEDRIQAAEELIRVLIRLETLGLVAGDLHPDNILVTDDGLRLLDVDSFTVYDAGEGCVYPTRDVKFRSLEMLQSQVAISKTFLTPKTHCFQGAMNVFTLLFTANPLDEHSFDSSQKDVVNANAAARRFAYKHMGKGFPVSLYGSRLADLFEKTFETADPLEIPSCGEYLEALQEVRKKGLKICSCCGSRVPALMACACPACGH